METIAIVLIMLSVVLHVGWNLVAKGSPSTAFFLTANLIAGVSFAPVLLLSAPGIRQAPTEIWTVLAITGLVQGLYCVALAAAYRSGDLSIVYPLVRSLAPAFVVLGSLSLGRGAALSAACVIGVVAIMLGSGLLGYGNLRANPGQAIHRDALGFSLAAALLVALYTLIDDAGVRLLGAAPALAAAWAGDATPLLGSLEPGIRNGLFYAALQVWAVNAWLALWVGASRRRREAWRGTLSATQIRDAAIMGVGSVSAYALVLAAMAHASDVSFVAGFRQLSVPIGAAVGFAWLGERVDAWKLAGLATMLLGLLLIAIDP